MKRGHRAHLGILTINITSMMDMFVIILVFLLKSFGASTASIQTSEDLRLPNSSSDRVPVELVMITIDKESMAIDGDVILVHENGVVDSQYLDKDGYKLLPLFQELSKRAEAAKFIAERNKNFEFEGGIILQMDKNLPFSFLRQIMYSAGQAEYNEFKFIAIKK